MAVDTNACVCIRCVRCVACRLGVVVWFARGTFQVFAVSLLTSEHQLMVPIPIPIAFSHSQYPIVIFPSDKVDIGFGPQRASAKMRYLLHYLGTEAAKERPQKVIVFSQWVW